MTCSVQRAEEQRAWRACRRIRKAIVRICTDPLTQLQHLRKGEQQYLRERDGTCVNECPCGQDRGFMS